MKVVEFQQAATEIGRTTRASEREILDIPREKHEYQGYRFEVQYNGGP